MAILVDSPNWEWRGRMWCHLVSDRSLEELHEFASALGIPARGFQGDHYDIPSEMRSEAIVAGAEAVTSRALVTALYDCGLRERPKQRTLP